MSPAEQKPFFKSYVYSTNDPGAIPYALSRGFYVVVILDKEEMQFYPGCICMSMLLPPPMLVLMLNNSDLSDPNYQNVYMQYMINYQGYLQSTAVEKHIANLLGAMYCTTHPTLLYTEYETDSQFHIMENIHSLFAKAFGIRIGRFEDYISNTSGITPTSAVFVPNPVFIGRVIDLLYLHNYITELEYARQFPVDAQGRELVPLSKEVASRLLAKYNCVFSDLRSTMVAAWNILRDYKRQVTTGQICPVVRITQELDTARMNEINSIVAQVQNRFGRKAMTGGAPNVQQIQQPQTPQIPSAQG